MFGLRKFEGNCKGNKIKKIKGKKIKENIKVKFDILFLFATIKSILFILTYLYPFKKNSSI